MHWQCAVCRETFDSSYGIVSVPCGHTFHESCLQPWVKSNPTCPTCRAGVRARDIRKIFLSSLDATIHEPRESELGENRQTIAALRDQVAQLQQEKCSLQARFEKSEQNAGRLRNKLSSATDQLNTAKTSLKIMRGTYQENVSLKELVGQLQSKLDESRGIQAVLKGTEKDVQDLLNSYGPGENSVRQIATFCGLLKRELEAAKAEVRVSRHDIGTLNRDCKALKNDVHTKQKELESAALELKKYKEQCCNLLDRLQNFSELQGAPPAAPSSRRSSNDYEGLTVKRLKRNETVVNSPPILRARTNLLGVQNPDVGKIPLTRTLPGYTKMKITQSLRKPEATVTSSSQDELLLSLMKSKSKSSDKDSIQRKGYNGLGGHSSFIQQSKR